MNKPKIEIGQCYRKDDMVYMVYFIDEKQYPGQVFIQNTLTRFNRPIERKELLTWERPFQNFG